LAEFKCFLPVDRACRAFFLCLPSERQADLKNAAKKLQDSSSGMTGSDGSSRSGASEALNHKSFKTSAQLERERLIRERQYMSESKLSGLKIYKQEFYVAIIRFAEERKKISNRLTDWHNLSDVLISVSTAIWVVVTAFILLLAFADNVVTFLLPMTTLLVSFSFIFGNTLRTVLESAIFVFVVRPYSVSDRIELRLHDDEYEVHSIQLLTTTLRSSTNKIIIIPNSVLLLQEITNLSRSSNAAYHIPITLALDVQAQRIGELKAHLEQYTMQHPIEWQTRVVITLCNAKNEKDMLTALFADVKVTHNSDWINGRVAADASLISFNTHLQQTLDLLQMRPKPALPQSPG
jgi:small-conductance mechanosensitive channel